MMDYIRAISKTLTEHRVLNTSQLTCMINVASDVAFQAQGSVYAVYTVEREEKSLRLALVGFGSIHFHIAAQVSISCTLSYSKRT